MPANPTPAPAPEAEHAKLSKDERRALETHNDWKAWGERFGFQLYGSNYDHYAEFCLSDGGRFVVPDAARKAIDASAPSLKRERDELVEALKGLANYCSRKSGVAIPIELTIAEEMITRIEARHD